MQEGKKPVIAFASTMGSFLESMENQHGEPISDGDMINADFSEVLTRGLDGLFAITEIDANGERKKKRLSLAALPEEAHRDYNQLLSAIRTISTGISISPIDNIKFHIEQSGYSVAEVTGRGTELQFQKHGSMATMVKNRKKENVSDAFRKFNNNQVDVLLINQSGSTGARRFVPRFPAAVANVKKILACYRVAKPNPTNFSFATKYQTRIRLISPLLPSIKHEYG